jgi:hypothetical protein
MRRINSRNSAWIFILATLAFAMVLPACRDEQDPLDRNRAPETYLTVAPPETVESDYRVHVFWHGEDRDGVVTRYMWFRSDTLRTLDPDANASVELLDWNPASRASDYVRGRFTSATDTFFLFTGYDASTGALLNRQAFHVVAIDDLGRMDQTPARIQFFAKVNCIPETSFWTSMTGTDGSWEPYQIGIPDTMSMFRDIYIKFAATTCNNVITGYRWTYSGKTYPDLDNNTTTIEWYIPSTDPPEEMVVDIASTPDNYLPSGDFYFRVSARDEAGALSKSDILTGIGVCRIAVNYDPDTRITHGDNSFTMRNGVATTNTVNFEDATVDTLPYGSRLRMHYMAWDNNNDILQYTDPELPLRFQTMFGRIGTAIDGGISSYKTPWYPTAKAEDTNCFADEDSVTMLIGTYEYFFAARSFDEQYRADGTPDTVRFFGNYAPTVDNIEVGIDGNLLTPALEFVPISTDTLFVNFAIPLVAIGEYCNPYVRTPNDADRTFTCMFKFFIRGLGHDDRRDPPGSGIKSWRFSILAAEDYYYRLENEWISDQAVNQFVQECVFKLVVPYDPSYPYPWPDSSFVDQQPAWMGEQILTVTGKDIKNTEITREGMRCTSPIFDTENPCVMNELGSLCVVTRYASNYARYDTHTKSFYMKLIYYNPF